MTARVATESESDSLDPVLARVLGRAFEATCAEMGSAMISTAVSAVFVECRDFSCALLDDQAELVAAANFDPSHLSAMALTGEYALMELGWENLEEGDAIVVNDPYRGGGHLPDICVIRPIFIEGELLGLAMNRGHHIDVGGMSVAGFPGTARSIFHEGIRIPPVKWYEGGVERKQVMDLLLLNVRFPREQLGDFRAQLASCVTAERRLTELVARHGFDKVKRAMEETKVYSERLMRAEIRAIPDGIYTFEDVMDDDGLGNGPYRIAVELAVDDDEVKISFDGTSAQAQGPINSSYGNTLSAVFNAFLHTFGADIPFNHGCFRPVTVTVRRGSFLNPISPAPVFGGVTETSIRIIDAVFGALGQVLPERACAGCYGTSINVAGGGWDDDRQKPFGVYLFQEGGWGGAAWRDGWTSVPNPTSNFNDYPAEVVESTLPLRCREFALSQDSAGPGRQRGGLGTTRTYELLSESCEISALGDRFVVPPFGLAGGHPGATARLELWRAGADRGTTFAEAFDLESASKFSSVRLERGDRIVMTTGGGGGYGPPHERSVESVMDDLRDRYGVIATEDDSGEWRVDEEASREARLSMAGRPTPQTAPAAPVAEPSLGGADANDVARVETLMDNVRSRIGDDPCRTRCPKRGNPTRCPFHHPFADKFWDGATLERWATEHCPIVNES
jgi:N-methylhydantoinase B/oxoprolinase/acetone carboxylase alpha subunit